MIKMFSAQLHEVAPEVSCVWPGTKRRLTMPNLFQAWQWTCVKKFYW